MFCKNCGTQLGDDVRFCHTCGMMVQTSAQPINTNPYQTQFTQQQSYSNAYQEPLREKHTQSNVYQNTFAQQYATTNTYQEPSISRTANQQAVGNPAYQTQYSSGTHEYQSLGGYLKVITIGGYVSGALCLIQIISMIVATISFMKVFKWLNEYNKGFVPFEFYSFSFIFLLLIVGAYMSFGISNRIKRKDPTFLRFLQLTSIISLIAGLVGLTIQLVWSKSFDEYGLIDYSSQIVNIIRIVISWIVMMIFTSVYFGKSVRVRTYMGSDEYLRRSLFNKNSNPIPAVADSKPSAGASTYDVTHRWRCPHCQTMISTNPCSYCAKTY